MLLRCSYEVPCLVDAIYFIVEGARATSPRVVARRRSQDPPRPALANLWFALGRSPSETGALFDHHALLGGHGVEVRVRPVLVQQAEPLE